MSPLAIGRDGVLQMVRVKFANAVDDRYEPGGQAVQGVRIDLPLTIPGATRF
jgi:hypothetical protein